MKRVIMIWALMISSLGLAGQSLTPEEVDYLNQEIRFLNESIHRMVIVFQVFENYNAKATQHVDLPTNDGILNTASHLPENLFADNNLVRSGDSPLELYDNLTSDPMHLTFKIDNWSMIERAKRVIDFLNQDRGQLDKIIEQKDLDIFANVQEIYASIEEAMDAYDQMRKIIKSFEDAHQSQYYQLNLPPEKRQVYTALTELHYDIKKLARQLREDNKSGVHKSVLKAEKELGWLRSCVAKLSSAQEKSDLTSSMTSIEKIVSEVKRYVRSGEVPDQYLAYGGGYHYHNYNLLPLMNQYGSGYVWKLEQFFKKYNWGVIHFIEEPHFIKIVYPKRIPIELMKSDEIDPEANIRDIAPEEVLPVIDQIVVSKDQTVEAQEKIEKEVPPQRFDIVESRVIKTERDSITIQLFDHLKKDGDRVSIFVNGEWVHKMISLETSWTTIDLAITPGQTNIVLIRAENTGWNPPNTFAIRYGDDQHIQKDLSTYQTIELKVTGTGGPFFQEVSN